MADSASRPHSYRAQKKYLPSERIVLLERYRYVVQRMKERGARVSPQALSDRIDDVFNTFSDWTSINDPWFIATSRDRLDPHTIRKMLSCDVELEHEHFQTGSLRVIDVFLQIITHDPPRSVAKFIRE